MIILLLQHLLLNDIYYETILKYKNILFLKHKLNHNTIFYYQTKEALVNHIYVTDVHKP